MCAVSSGLGLRLWFRERTKPAVHRTGEGHRRHRPLPPRQVCSQPGLHLGQKGSPALKPQGVSRGQHCLIDFETVTVKRLIKT